MAKTAVSLAVLYTLFAAFSTAINIGAQMLCIWAYTGPYSVEVSILIGTGAGLPLRYLLEKRYIFAFQSNNIAHDGKLFVLYSFMGVFTTAIFWGVEYAFHFIFATDIMRYVGGVIGLSLGFYIKYQLDKKYVFVSGDKQVAV
ncbi:GtrA family protein [beta proteobacterium MWH-UniP1]